MAKKSFYLVKRADRLTVDVASKKKKPTYYVRFRDAEGVLLPWRSTGETTKTAAENWALTKLGKAKKRREAMTLEGFAKGFWAASGRFVQERASHGYPLGHGYLEIAESNTRNHLIPAWGSWRLLLSKQPPHNPGPLGCCRSRATHARKAPSKRS